MAKLINNDKKIERLTLANSFNKYFKVKFANSNKLKEQIYHIRYHVYCKEFHYESIENYPDEMEIDEYDEDSLHCLIIHKSSNIPAACVRLVPATVNGKIIPLPFEKNCNESLDKNYIEQLKLDPITECEISRLAVDGLFRKRSGESITRFGSINQEISKEEQRSFQMIAVSAFLAATVLTELSGKTNVFAMMEPFLPRLLKRSGIIFQRAGEDIDYHGIRAPYFITTQSALDNMRPELLELYQSIHLQIEKSYHQPE